MGKYDQYIPKASSIPAHKIAAWIEKNFDFKLAKNGEEYLICDPFDGDSRFRFGINPEKGVCHSWHGDEWAGARNPRTGKRNCSIINFVKVLKKCTYREAVAEILGSTNGIEEYIKPSFRTTPDEPLRIIEVALPEGVQPLAVSTDMQAKPLLKWLKSRAYAFEEVQKAELQHLGMTVYWPYFEFDALVYWQSRSRLNKRFDFPRKKVMENGVVIGETEGSKGKFLYGFDDVEIGTYVSVTEAIFDMHTIGENALASGGADLTVDQVNKLKILNPRKGVILSPDNDGPGLKSVINNYRTLDGHGFKTFYTTPPKIEYEEDGEKKFTKDWNELYVKLKMSKDEIRALHDSRIKKLTMASAMKLRASLK